jgi:hypothetical protein
VRSLVGVDVEAGTAELALALTAARKAHTGRDVIENL